MFYEEKTIDGITYYRTTPNGEWKELQKQNNMNIETTPELILEAAAKCPQAKEALKTLFPKVFEKSKEFDCYSLAKTPLVWEIGEDSFEHPCIGVHHKNRNAFYLGSNDWDWKLEKQDGLLFLIPTRK